MDEQYVTHIVLQQHCSSSSYSERETAAVSHMRIGTIRHLRALDLIEGEETGGNIVTARKRSHNCGGSADCNTTWASTWRESK